MKKDFYYDQYDRLITAYGPWGKISYRYDSMDNLTQKIEKDNKWELDYDKKSSKIKQLKKNGEKVEVKYDKLGRMIRYGEMSFKYNTIGRLKKIIKGNEVQVELFYNYKNQRVIEKNEAEEFYYIYDNQDRIMAKYDNQGKLLKEYIYNKEIPLGFIKDNKIYYYHYDLMNFPIMISDESGKVIREVQYKPYGEIIYKKGEFDDSLRFPGQYEISDTDLYYNMNRTYTPTLTRYLEPDLFPIRSNIYQYSNCNPLRYIDQKGLQANEKWCYRSLLKDDPLEDKNSVRIAFSSIFVIKFAAAGVIGGEVESCDCFLKNGDYEYLWGNFRGILGGGSATAGLLPFTKMTCEMNFESITPKYPQPTMKEFGKGGFMFFGKNKNISIEFNDLTGEMKIKIGNVKTTDIKYLKVDWVEKAPSYGHTVLKGRMITVNEQWFIDWNCEY